MFCYKSRRRLTKRSIDTRSRSFIIFPSICYPSILPYSILFYFYFYFDVFRFVPLGKRVRLAGMSGWSVGWLVGFVSWLITYLLAYLLALLRLKSKSRHGEQETDLIPLCTDAPLFALTFVGRFCLHTFCRHNEICFFYYYYWLSGIWCCRGAILNILLLWLLCVVCWVMARRFWLRLYGSGLLRIYSEYLKVYGQSVTAVVKYSR